MDDNATQNNQLQKLNTVFSFEPYYNFLQRRIHTTDTVKKAIFQILSDRVVRLGAHNRSIATEETGAFTELFQMIYAGITGIYVDGGKDLWGITVPFDRRFVYGTPSVYNTFVDEHTGLMKPGFQGDLKDIESALVRNIYDLILTRLYNFECSLSTDLVYKHYDAAEEMNKYFDVKYNSDFVDLHYCKGQLPVIDRDMLGPRVSEEVQMQYLQSILPLEDICFRGLSIITISDKSYQHYLGKVKNALWNDKESIDKGDVIDDFQNVVRILLDSSGIYLANISMIKLNNRYLRGIGRGFIGDGIILEDEPRRFFLEKFVEDGNPVLVDDVYSDTGVPKFLKQSLKETPYVSYAAIPIYYRQEVRGIVELFSKKKGIITKDGMMRLRHINSEVAQMMLLGQEFLLGKFHEIRADRFTVIQPAVSWKFDEVTMDYLNQVYLYGKVKEPIPILFKSVRSLYGAVDIKDSTIIRNKAILADYRQQSQLLQEVYEALEPYGLSDFNSKLAAHISLMNSIGNLPLVDEITLSKVKTLNRQIQILLQEVTEDKPAARSVIETYLGQVADGGSAMSAHQNLDGSMKKVIASIELFTDEMNDAMQAVFPGYFDKFRTDGVEYDLYVGSSMSQGQHFEKSHLAELYRLQLIYMRKIAVANKEMQAQLSEPLLTTQLIFVSPDTIDIAFREDEKRFDVHGAYSIRYQMIKKRIDKVRLKDSEERLTQQGRIAVVYMKDEDIADFENLIKQEISAGLLYNLEYLELEQLQGVNGLKALRVSVQGAA